MYHKIVSQFQWYIITVILNLVTIYCCTLPYWRLSSHYSHCFKVQNDCNRYGRMCKFFFKHSPLSPMATEFQDLLPEQIIWDNAGKMLDKLIILYRRISSSRDFPLKTHSVVSVNYLYSSQDIPSTSETTIKF